MLATEVPTSWPDAIIWIVITICVASFWMGGWPWEGIIHKTYICKCKKNCPCKEHDEDEEDED